MSLSQAFINISFCFLSFLGIVLAALDSKLGIMREQLFQNLGISGSSWWRLTFMTLQLDQTCNEFLYCFNGVWFSRHHFEIWSKKDIKPFFLVQNRSIMNFSLSQDLVSYFGFKKRKNYHYLICKTLVSHPGTPCHNKLRMCNSIFNRPGLQARPSHGIDLYVCLCVCVSVCLSPQQPGTLGTL